MTFGVSPAQVTYHTELVFLYRENAWQLLEIRSFEEDRALSAIGYPGTELADEPFDAQPSFQIVDGQRSPVDDDSTVMTLAIGDGPTGAILTCTGGLTRVFANGIANFEGCELDKVGAYTLMATATGATPVETEPFDIVQSRGTLIPNGDPLTLTTLVPGIAAWFAFEANGGDNYSIVLESADVETADVYIRRQDSVSFVTGGSIESGVGYIESTMPGGLEEAGYFLVVRGLNETVGRFTATLHTFEDEVEPISADAEESGWFQALAKLVRRP